MAQVLDLKLLLANVDPNKVYTLTDIVSKGETSRFDVLFGYLHVVCKLNMRSQSNLVLFSNGVAGKGYCRNNTPSQNMISHVELVASGRVIDVRAVILAHRGVMGCWMRLGEEISEVLLAGVPEHVEVSLSDAVSDPVVPHGDGLGASLLHGVGGNSLCTFVVSNDGCCTLGVADVL